MANIDIEKLEIGLPSMGTAKTGLEDYRVKIVKLDLDEPGDVLLYEQICTRALSGIDLVLRAREQFTFQERCFLILEYLEKTNAKTT